MTQAIPRKRGRPKRATDNAEQATGAERLLAMAMEAFACKGFSGASVRDIASAAQVDPALIKHQFGSKADLWRAAVDTLSAQLLLALKPVRLVTENGESKSADALADIVAHLVDFACDTPLVAKFVLTELAQQDDRSDYVFQKLVRPIHDLVVPFIAETADQSGARLDPDLMFIAFNGAIVTSVAARPFITRMSAQAESEVYFRDQLKRTVLAQLLPATRKG